MNKCSKMLCKNIACVMNFKMQRPFEATAVELDRSRNGKRRKLSAIHYIPNFVIGHWH